MRDEEVLQRRGVGVRGLLEEPVEEQGAAGGGAAVEAEGELVEVVGQLFPGDELTVLSAGHTRASAPVPSVRRRPEVRGNEEIHPSVTEAK